LWGGEAIFRVAFDEGFDERRFSNSGRAHHSDDNGGRFFRETVDERYMEALFFDLSKSAKNLPSAKMIYLTS